MEGLTKRRLVLVDEASERRSRVEQAVATASDQRNLALDMDLQGWFDCYLTDCEARGLSPRTLEWYQDRGKRMLYELQRAGVIYPNQLSRRCVSQLMTALRQKRHHGRPLSPQTLKGYWQVGKGFVTFLIAEEVFIGSNAFDQFGKPRVPEKAMWAPSRQDCVAMLKVPDRKTLLGLRDALILQLLLDTGCGCLPW